MSEQKIRQNSPFLKTLKPFVVLFKVSGLRRFSYCVDGSPNSTIYNESSWYVVGDIVQIGFYLVLSVVMLNQTPNLLVFYYDVSRYWMIFVAARLSEPWSIKLINEMIDYDVKYKTLPLFIPLRTPSIQFWLSLCALYFVHFVILHVVLTVKVMSKFGIDHTITALVFDLPRFTDFVIVASVYFFLANLACRFRTLTKYWKRLPAALLTKPGTWKRDEVVMLVESCRLLHANLSNTLRMLSLTYGPVLLVLFLFLIFDMIYAMFLLLYLKNPHFSSMPAIALFVENVFFIIILLALGSWTTSQKKQMVLYLRSCQITDLPEDITAQLKCFMNQISNYDMYEMSAYGVFNYDLTMFLSLLAALFTFIVTLIKLEGNQTFETLVDKFFMRQLFLNRTR